MNYKRIVPNSISGLSLILGVFSIYYTIDKDFSPQLQSALFFLSLQTPWTVGQPDCSASAVPSA
jgi:phosphatidylserine synthase